MSFDTPEEVVAYIGEESVEFVDTRFMDTPGTKQHFAIPASIPDEDAMTEGLAFDGSSVRGSTFVDESDVALLFDLGTTRIDPFHKTKTLGVRFFIHDPFTLEPLSRDPRSVAEKAERYLISIGIADTCFFDAEAEFYIFDNIKFETETNRGFYEADSVESWQNYDGDESPDGSVNLGYKARLKGGYFPVTPHDHYQDLYDKMYLQLANAGFELEHAHHEVGTGGRQEINHELDMILHAADGLQSFKYIIKDTAWEEGESVTFMLKPLSGDNGSSMYARQSLWKDGRPLFRDEADYAGLPDIARWYVGSTLHHIGAALAFTNPTLNSYHRLVKGFKVPINLVYSQRNHSAAVRVPITGSNPEAKRIEFRAPDPPGNPHLNFVTIVMAGLNGVKDRIGPHTPVDEDLYELPPEEAADIPQALTSLEAALEALHNNHEFLPEGDVFTENLIQTYIDYRYEDEVEPARLCPTSQEPGVHYDY